jgi:hypothetical protein
MPCAFAVETGRLLRLLLVRVDSMPTGSGWKLRVLSLGTSEGRSVILMHRTPAEAMPRD